MKTYTLTSPAYGQERGQAVRVDENDKLVQMNIANGVLIPVTDAKLADEKMTCPICQEHMQRPTKLSDPSSLEAHYEEKHAGFVVPTWQADKEDEEA